jgi:hypothetical protein
MRRIAAAAVFLGILATLLIAARHNHFDHRGAAHGDVCVHCTGAMMSAPVAPDVKPAAVRTLEAPWLLPVSPAKLWVLRADHSGCAPPRA